MYQASCLCFKRHVFHCYAADDKSSIPFHCCMFLGLFWYRRSLRKFLKKGGISDSGIWVATVLSKWLSLRKILLHFHCYPDRPETNVNSKRVCPRDTASHVSQLLWTMSRMAVHSVGTFLKTFLENFPLGYYFRCFMLHISYLYLHDRGRITLLLPLYNKLSIYSVMKSVYFWRAVVNSVYYNVLKWITVKPHQFGICDNSDFLFRIMTLMITLPWSQTAACSASMDDGRYI
jgi:hypothetical protein